MSTFMILYRSTASAREQMANATPAQREAGLEAWRTWATKVGYALTDLGTPLAHTTHVGPGAASTDGVCGYTILEAKDLDEAIAVATGIVGTSTLATIEVRPIVEHPGVPPVPERS